MSKQKKKSTVLKKRARRESSGLLLQILRWFFWLVVVCLIAGAGAGMAIYGHLIKDLPKISTLSDYHPSIITTIYSDDNRKIAEFFRERRIVIPLSEMPETLTQAFVAAEDDRFYIHKGVDLISIARAFFKNIEAGAIVQGGSTITQQVTKSLLLTPEKSYERKIKEAILAYRIDKTLSKEEILYLYLNQIYLGHGAYGVEAAAGNYFNKSAKDLNLAECAMLAGLPQAPSRYSPFKNPDLARQRQIYVLNRMVAEGYITNLQATEAINTELDIKPRKNWYIEEVPYYTEHIRRYIENTYGSDVLYTQGLEVHTAVNVEMQKAAREQIEKGLRALDKRQGYRGPLKQLAPTEIEPHLTELKEAAKQTEPEADSIVEGVVVAVDNQEKTVSVRTATARGVIALENMRWARIPNPELYLYEDPVTRPGDVLAVGDVILVRLIGPLARAETEDVTDTGAWDLALEQTPEVQSALLSIEAGTGLVKAMVGGREFASSQFNRAIQSRRQPGSSFKPIIYTAALLKGYTPASVVIDSAVVYKDAESDFKWKPDNYEKTFHGPTLLRDALAKSRNIISIKLLMDVGIDETVSLARKFGISSPLSQDLSISLGSSGISLLELVTAYSVFANEGNMIEPIFITKIVDRNGNVLELREPEKTRVLDKATAYIMTDMLKSVVQSGTGRRVRALGRPVAGKTGTTNNLYDAWFLGFTPNFITGTWVGHDEEQPLGKGETGSRAASPIWLGFMQEVLKDEPVLEFPIPESVMFSQIDAETGLLPGPGSTKTRFEVFKEGTAPTETTQPKESVIENDEFFKLDL
jgi:penicillin-binding protein 1A